MTKQPSSLKIQPVAIGVLVIVVFLICWACARYLPFQPKTLLELFITYYTWYWLPPLVVLLIVFGRDALKVWGFTRAPLQSLGISIAMVLPALIGFASTATLKAPDFAQIISRAVLPGVMEETLYRGFLFGILFKHARWGFIPAALITAMVFGVGHLYQGNDLLSALGAFAITAMGSVWLVGCSSPGIRSGFQSVCI